MSERPESIDADAPADRPPTSTGAPPPESSRIGRRVFLAGTGALAAAWAGRQILDWNENFLHADVAIVRAPSYADDLVPILRRGLEELGFSASHFRGKSILLKPNLVEPSREAPHINTHPMVVLAAAQVFRSWDAREVVVAEGQGHERDSYLVLDQSGLGPVLDEAGLRFVDLNHDEIVKVPNALKLSELEHLYFPATLCRADVVVSMPKLKTHHWAGVTLSMKNLFGVMPGIVYGWPKNVLHKLVIGKSILDIAATVKPQLAIVDAIVGMEGDGPIMGTPRQVGALVMGTNFPSVDATCTRLMGMDPRRIEYLAWASGRMGPIREPGITQRGESIDQFAQPFELLDDPYFDRYRG